MYAQMKKKAPTVEMIARPILDSLLFKKRGFGQEFIASWPHIVGNAHAANCYPLKINWPSTKHNQQVDVSLLVACNSGETQLYLQHHSAEILQRANVFFGYSALTKLKLKQVRQVFMGERDVAVF